MKHGVEVIEGNQVVSNPGGWSYLAIWGQQTLNDDKLGMALLYQKGTIDKVTEDEHNHVAIGESRDNRHAALQGYGNRGVPQAAALHRYKASTERHSGLPAGQQIDSLAGPT